MKKSIIAFSLLTLFNLNAQEYFLNLGNQSDIVIESISNPSNNSDNNNIQYFNSCNQILLDNPSSISGIHTIENNSENYEVFCDMTTHGGWTLVAVQYEHDPVPNWNEGIQSDYDADGNIGFALNTNQLPTHSQISFGQEDARVLNSSPFI